MVDGQTSQVIAPALSLPMPVTDLRDLPPTERDAAARKAVHEEAQRPFDLAAGPLLRVSFLRLADDPATGTGEHVLLLTVHHIVSDDWSMGVFVAELATLYQAFKNGQGAQLPELPIQYADYAAWQRSDAHKEQLDSQLKFWKERLAPLASQPPLPTDRPRQATQTYHGERRFRMFPEALAGQLKTLSQREESTLFMTLLAGINILLRQYMGGSQVVVGSPVAGRNKREVEGLIGFFVNTVVLRTDLSGDPSFRELLARVREVTTSAYAHQDVPFEHVVESLRAQQEQGALFHVFFNMLNAASQQVEIPGLTIKPFSDFIVGAPDIGAKFDLTLVAVEHPHGLQVDISYNIDLFEPSTIDWFLEHLQTILESAVANPGLPLSALPRLPIVAHKRVEPSQPFVEFPLEEIEQSLTARFEKQAARHPDRVAIVHKGKTLSYNQLNRSANHLARQIQQDYPASTQQDEQSVALLLGHDAQAITAMLAALKCGRIFVALDPGYPRERLNHMLDDSNAQLIVTDSQHLSLAESLMSGLTRKVGILNIDRLDSSLADINLLQPIDPGQIAYIVYTSGSMGRAKGVMQSHRNVLHFIRNYTNSLHLSSDDRLSLIPSFSFSAAMMDIFGALVNGASLYPFDVSQDGLDNLADWLNENKITVYHSVPTIFRHFVATLPEGTSFPHLRLIDFGGEPVSRRDIELYRSHFSPECILVNGLGATELNVIRQFVMNHETEFIGDSVPVGYAVPDTTILLLDENGDDAGYNQPGEMVIESRYLSPGYWRQPEQTQASFKVVDGNLRRYYTGDLGRMRPDGCLEHYGRKDLQVKIRGVRIEPAEIETVLLAQGAIKEAAVIAQDNAAGEKMLVAYMVAKDPAAEPSVDALRILLLEKLPPSMLPSEFVFLGAMPLTPTGKIDRRALAIPEKTEVAEPTDAYVAPRTPMEKMLVEIGLEVLKVERIGVNDSFFGLGGDSLLAAQFISRIRSACQVELPFRVVFRMPTIAKIAAYVEEVQTAQRLQAIPAGATEGEREEGEL
jgi:amino acid adenylation domain-containing protein